MSTEPMPYLDARYDQERKVCACGGVWFVELRPIQVHADERGVATALLPAAELGPEMIFRLPIAECVQCRTRYDRLWREVV